MSTSHDNVTHLTGQEPETVGAGDGIAERVDKIIRPSFEQLAHYLKTGEGDPREEIIEDALLLTDAFSEDLDGVHRDALWLLHRILLMGKSIDGYKRDKRDQQRAAERQREETEREAWNCSPAATVDLVGFMTGIVGRSREQVEKALTDLDAVDPKAATIVRARIEAGHDATLYITDMEIGEWRAAILRDAEGKTLNSWRVGPETVETLRPLEEADQGDTEGSSDDE